MAQSYPRAETHTQLQMLSEHAYYANGVVTAPHYLAAIAGLDILRHGGTAVDACISMASTLCVVFPHMCTLGGDAFWLIYAHDTGQMYGINASGRAALAASRDFYQKKGMHHIPPRGYLAINTVPGLVHGLKTAFEFSQKTLGSRCNLALLMQSALTYAREGFAVSPSLAKWSAKYLEGHAKDPKIYPLETEFTKTFFPEGQSLRHGTRFVQPDLAKSLEILLKEGLESFYQGSLAQAMGDDLRSHGAPLDTKDFKEHTSTFVTPIKVNYRGYTAYNLPPNTQGLASLEILNILQNFDVRSLQEGSAQYYHLLVEATKLAFRDRDHYITDPAWADIPVDELLAQDYGAKQAASLNLHRATPYPTLDPLGDTVYVAAIDTDGNAVSMLQSIYYDFGAAIVPKGTGIILQNRGCYFSLDPLHVNVLAPGKRTLHTLNPAMLLKEGRPTLVYGSMGGEGQPQTQAQLVTRIVDFAMSPYAALALPRFLFGRSWGAPNNKLFLENRVPQDVVEKLRQYGHELQITEAFSDLMGHAGALVCDPITHLYQGASDPRSDGLAIGF